MVLEGPQRHGLSAVEEEEVKGIRTCHPKICHSGTLILFELKVTEKHQMQEGLSDCLLPT